MQTFLVVLAIFAVAVVLMAVGVIFSNRRLKGTCGGLGGMTDSQGRSICDACTTPSKDCTGTPGEHNTEHEDAEAVSDSR
jgi:uncharacterized protein